MGNRWQEFLQVNGEFAIRNLTIFITISVASGVIIYLTGMDRITTEIFSAYLLAGGGVYSFGKWQDEKSVRSKIDVDAPPDINTTTVNKAEAVNVSGDINVKPKVRKK